MKMAFCPTGTHPFPDTSDFLPTEHWIESKPWFVCKPQYHPNEGASSHHCTSSNVEHGLEFPVKILWKPLVSLLKGHSRSRPAGLTAFPLTEGLSCSRAWLLSSEAIWIKLSGCFHRGFTGSSDLCLWVETGIYREKCFRLLGHWQQPLN